MEVIAMRGIATQLFWVTIAFIMALAVAAYVSVHWR